MADFRKAKYSGSLNLAPECGPVLIELDTDAKTATASLEDPASQYTLAGGGGGLDYVIPEQTVTFETSTSEVEIGENSLDDIQVGNSVIAKAYYTAHNFTEYSGMFCGEEGRIESTSETGTINFYKENNKWTAMLQNQNAQYPLTATISAIRGF